MWKRNFPARFWNFPQFLGFLGQMKPHANCWCQPRLGRVGLVLTRCSRLQAKWRNGSSRRKKWNEAWKTTWDGWVIWLVSAWRHPNCDVQTLFSLRLLGLGVKMSSLEDEWKSKFTFHSSLHDHNRVWNFSCPPRQVLAWCALDQTPCRQDSVTQYRNWVTHLAIIYTFTLNPYFYQVHIPDIDTSLWFTQ